MDKHKHIKGSGRCSLWARFAGVLLVLCLWAIPVQGATWYWDAGPIGKGTVWGPSGPPKNYQLNWDTDTNPTTVSGVPPDVIFDDTYVTKKQTIELKGGNKTVKTVTFQGQYAYTLTTKDSSMLIFDVGTSGAPQAEIKILSGSLNSEHVIAVDVQLNSDLKVDNQIAANQFTMSGNINAGAHDLTVTGAGNTLISESITGTGTLVKTGTGVLDLTGESLGFVGGLDVSEGTVNITAIDGLGAVTTVNVSGGYVEAAGKRALGGATDVTISGGTLELSGSDALQSAQTILISGGTLLLQVSDAINSTADLELAGGTFQTDGFNQTLDTLTLSEDSTIDLNPSGNSKLNFTDAIYTSGRTLTIAGWDGSAYSSTGSEIIFSNTLSSEFLANIYWEDQNVLGAVQLASGEIVPVPEPGTLLVGGFLLGLGGLEAYRRRRKRSA